MGFVDNGAWYDRKYFQESIEEGREGCYMKYMSNAKSVKYNDSSDLVG